LPLAEVGQWQVVADNGSCVCVREKSQKRYITIAGVYTVAVAQTATARTEKGNGQLKPQYYKIHIYDIDLFFKLIFRAI